MKRRTYLKGKYFLKNTAYIYLYIYTVAYLFNRSIKLNNSLRVLVNLMTTSFRDWMYYNIFSKKKKKLSK